jgi:hypothetical protein
MIEAELWDNAQNASAATAGLNKAKPIRSGVIRSLSSSIRFEAHRCYLRGTAILSDLRGSNGIPEVNRDYSRNEG